MRKVLKVMLKVILWLAPVGGFLTFFLVAFWQLMGWKGFVIKILGKNLLDKSVTENVSMTYKEYKELTKDQQKKVLKEAYDVVSHERISGWDWWLNK